MPKRSLRLSPSLHAVVAVTSCLALVAACVGDDPGDRQSGADGGTGDEAGTSGAPPPGSSGAPETPSLTVTLEGDGRVTSSPAGIDCGVTCSAAFARDTTVKLTATAGTDRAFIAWSGDARSCGTSPTCDLTMDGEKNVRAVFAQTKAAVWVKSIASSGTDADVRAALDAAGNVYVTTNLGGAAKLDDVTYASGKILVAKLTPTGELVWAKTFGGAAGANVSAITVGKTGDVAIAGITSSESAAFDTITLDSDGEDPFVVKLSGADGSVRWGKVITTNEADGPGLGSVAMDSLGNVFVSGHYNTSVNFNDGAGEETTLAGEQASFVAKLASASGKTTGGGWRRILESARYTYGSKLVVDPADDLVIGGYFSEDADFGAPNPMASAGIYDGFVAKLSGTDGSGVWQKRIGGTGDDAVTSIALAGSEVVVLARLASQTSVAQEFFDLDLPTPTTSSFDLALGRLNSDGAVLWGKRYGGTANDFPYEVAVLADNRYAITGSSYAAIKFDGQTELSTGASGDGWFAVLEAGSGGGAPQATWSFKASSPGIDTGQVVVGRDKLLYGFGKFIQDGTVLGTELVNAGSYDTYLFAAAVP